MPVAGHWSSLKHAAPDALQWPCSVGQPASDLEPEPDVEQVPGTIGHSPRLWHTAEVIEHCPEGAQSPSTRHACASWLHAPGTVGQSGSTTHAAWVTVHCPPAGRHWASVKQATPVIWHARGWVGQSAGPWQRLATSEQCPSGGHCASAKQGSPVIVHAPVVGGH